MHHRKAGRAPELSRTSTRLDTRESKAVDGLNGTRIAIDSVPAMHASVTDKVFNTATTLSKADPLWWCCRVVGPRSTPNKTDQQDRPTCIHSQQAPGQTRHMVIKPARTYNPPSPACTDRHAANTSSPRCALPTQAHEWPMTLAMWLHFNKQTHYHHAHIRDSKQHGGIDQQQS